MIADVRKAIKFSMHNRQYCETTNRCGCYYCTAIFPPNEIVEWTDKKSTAICPKCGIDAVIPEAPDFMLSHELLMKMNQYWFQKDK